ncbi:unnamed protein product [Prorocentrum cordatum]|uniref:Uncharacterized protein n=1 Tax=Prorocentrum cordatum TaxID=2364126 RepID=A0ABN9S7W7_9DINO|nr:unnamed protein product [Polarella glacialis]
MAYKLIIATASALASMVGAELHLIQVSVHGSDGNEASTPAPTPAPAMACAEQGWNGNGIPFRIGFSIHVTSSFPNIASSYLLLGSGYNPYMAIYGPGMPGVNAGTFQLLFQFNALSIPSTTYRVTLPVGLDQYYEMVIVSESDFACYVNGQQVFNTQVDRPVFSSYGTALASLPPLDGALNTLSPSTFPADSAERYRICDFSVTRAISNSTCYDPSSLSTCLAAPTPSPTPSPTPHPTAPTPAPTFEQTTDLWLPVLSTDHAGGTVGRYFNFDWVAELGSGTVYWPDLRQCRGGVELAVGSGVLWQGANGGTAGNSHGRFDSAAAIHRDWKVGDIATNGNCQPSPTPSPTPSPIPSPTPSPTPYPTVHTPHPGSDGGFVLAMRFATFSQFTFSSDYWTNDQLVDEADADPYKDADGKFDAFLSAPATEIRGSPWGVQDVQFCLHGASHDDDSQGSVRHYSHRLLHEYQVRRIDC